MTKQVHVSEDGQMLNLERQNEILQLLIQRKSMTVKALAELLFTSESTIRRDLNELEKVGKVRRTFGGVVLEETLTKEVPHILRKSQNYQAKQIIAKKAREYIENGKVIFLDASTTVAHLVPILSEFSDLTVITNSPATAMKLGEERIRTFCTGGELLMTSQAFVGTQSEEFIKGFNADIMFFSSRGISEDGRITDSSVEESRIRQVMMGQAKKKIYMFDSSKLGREYMFNLCHVKEADAFITEKSDILFEKGN